MTFTHRPIVIPAIDVAFITCFWASVVATCAPFSRLPQGCAVGLQRTGSCCCLVGKELPLIWEWHWTQQKHKLSSMQLCLEIVLNALLVTNLFKWDTSVKLTPSALQWGGANGRTGLVEWESKELRIQCFGHEARCTVSWVLPVKVIVSFVFPVIFWHLISVHTILWWFLLSLSRLAATEARWVQAQAVHVNLCAGWQKAGREIHWATVVHLYFLARA